MSIVKRIQEAYPIRYCVTGKAQPQTVSLTFQEGVPEALQQALTTAMEERFPQLIPIAEGMLHFHLQPDETKGCYELKLDGATCYRFAAHSPFVSENLYTPADAIAWIIYILAIGHEKTLLSGWQGGYISSHTFCARQQTVAAEYHALANSQYQSVSFSDDSYNNLLKELAPFCQQAINEAPFFSHQPLSENGYNTLHSGLRTIFGNRSISLKQLCQKLFGSAQAFLTEIDDYCTRVRGSKNYEQQLRMAVERLDTYVGSVPFLKVDDFLNELSHRVKALPASVPTISDDTVAMPQRSIEALEKSLESVDKAFSQYIANRIRKDFFLAVIEQVHTQLQNELLRVAKPISEAYGALSRFSAIPGESKKGLHWRQLASPETADIYTPNLDWTWNTFSDLQRTVTSNNLWLCADTLLEEMHENNPDAAGMDRTHAMPISDKQYVIAFWKDTTI